MALPKLEDHVFRVLENFHRLSEAAEGLNWNLSMDSETLTFYHPKTLRVAFDCPAQLVGTEDERTGTWLWAWANEGSDIPGGMLEAVKRLKSVAEAGGADPFYQNPRTFRLPHPNFGTEMAILAAGVSDGYTTYRCPYDGGAAYLVVESCPKAVALPDSPLRISKAIMDGVSNFALDHRAAVAAYLGEPGPDGFYERGIKIGFDAQGRVGPMDFVLTPEAAPPRSPLSRFRGLFQRGSRG
jgi:hypothetical protein